MTKTTRSPNTAKARRARDELAHQFLDHPDVSLIDIGYDTTEGVLRTTLAVRIHVRESWTAADPSSRTAFPKEIDGVSVIVIPGNYALE